MIADDLIKLRSSATNKMEFTGIPSYFDFAKRYLEYISNPTFIQAEIVSQNEQNYRFIQYKKSGHFNVTRPLNSQLFYSFDDFEQAASEFLRILDDERDHVPTLEERAIINRTIYTAQQSIGAALDSLPAGESNKARKINGDLFERFIRLIVIQLGVNCTAGTVNVPVLVDGQEEFSMSYQHDLIIKSGELVKAIGSVKTSSKDRIDKIFIDKFLFNKLTGKNIPHIAIFLNDVQRKGKEPNFGISATFLPGHFKGYTVKLNPLDGVYYCDIRPNMQTDDVLKRHMRTFDHFVFGDLWTLLSRDSIVAEVEAKEL